MFFVFNYVLFIYAVILIAVSAAVAYLVIRLVSSAIIFSRVSMALAVALIVSQTGPELVPNYSFLNFVAWATIFFGAIYLLSMLPRVDMALQFMCTNVVSLVIIEIIALLILSFSHTETGESYTLTLSLEIIIRIICIIFSVGAIIFKKKKPSYQSPSNIILLNLERLFSSLVYGMTITILLSSFGNTSEFPAWLDITILAVSTVIAFIVDILLFNKNILSLDKPQEVSIP